MIKIICTSCQKPLSLDETKLPMKEVGFPCPVCKTKLTVDRRKLAGAGAAPGAAEGDEGDDNENEFGAKAFIVGNDHPSLRHASKLIGYLPIHYPTAELARDRYMQDMPHVIILNPAQVTPPPLEAMQPIISLTSSDRRKSFFILVSENLRSLDGNAAFLYGVNLVVAQKDLGSFQQIYKEAHGYHERMYASLTVVLRSMDG